MLQKMYMYLQFLVKTTNSKELEKKKNKDVIEINCSDNKYDYSTEFFVINEDMIDNEEFNKLNESLRKCNKCNNYYELCSFYNDDSYMEDIRNTILNRFLETDYETHRCRCDEDKYDDIYKPYIYINRYNTPYYKNPHHCGSAIGETPNEIAYRFDEEEKKFILLKGKDIFELCET